MKDLKETKNLDLLKEIAVKINSGEGKMELSDDDLENISGGYYSVENEHELLNFYKNDVKVLRSDGAIVWDTMKTILYYGKDCCGLCGLEQTTRFFECNIPDGYGKTREVVDVCESCLGTL